MWCSYEHAAPDYGGWRTNTSYGSAPYTGGHGYDTSAHGPRPGPPGLAVEAESVEHRTTVAVPARPIHRRSNLICKGLFALLA